MRCPTCEGPMPQRRVGTWHPDTPCVNCWEVEQRLRTYLRSEKGRAFVRQMLEMMEEASP